MLNESVILNVQILIFCFKNYLFKDFLILEFSYFNWDQTLHMCYAQFSSYLYFCIKWIFWGQDLKKEIILWILIMELLSHKMWVSSTYWTIKIFIKEFV